MNTLYLLASGRQPSDMGVASWCAFAFAATYDLLFIAFMVWGHWQRDKHEHKSTEWREWDSLLFTICLPGLLPFMYSLPLLLMPFGFMDLPDLR